MRTWLSVTQAAEYAGVSKDTIYTACERREIRHARISGRRSIRMKPEWSTSGWNDTRARPAVGSGFQIAASRRMIVERAWPARSSPGRRASEGKL